MVPRSTLVRSALATLLAVFAAFVALAPRAQAEDAFVLDNGAVLRGTVLREDDKEIVFKLEGIGRDGRVTIEKSRIAQRFVTKDPHGPVVASKAPGAAGRTAEGEPAIVRYLPATGVHAPTDLAPMLVRMSPLPDEEPAAKEENFFERTARRAILAFPKSPAMRSALVALAIALLLALVEIGGRMVDIDGLSLGKSTTLALLLGLLITLDVLSADTLLRADRAPLIILAELLAWIGCAAGILRCGVASAVQLLAFVLFSGALVALVTGALLVTI